MWWVWFSSVARSCATRGASNKDYVWQPTIPAGINRPPPSETISHVTRVLDHQTRLAGLQDSCLFRTRNPVRECLFIYGGMSRAKNLEHRRGAKSHRCEDSWSDETGRRNDPTRETSEPALRTPRTEVEATPRRVRGSSWEREYGVPY